MEMSVAGSVETTSMPQTTRRRSEQHLIMVSPGHSWSAVSALCHSEALWKHFAARTPTFTLSIPRRWRVNFGNEYGCLGGVETTSTPQMQRLGSDEHCVMVSSSHSRSAVSALCHSEALWKPFSAPTPTFIQSIQHRWRVKFDNGDECGWWR